MEAIDIKHFGDVHGIVVKYEELKDLLTQKRIEAEKKIPFFNQVRIENMALKDTLAKYSEILENKTEVFQNLRHKK